MTTNAATLEALSDVGVERHRQEAKLVAGDWSWTCATNLEGVTDADRYVVLGEEFGEVGRAILERSNLREELVHCAAVCVAWIESIDGRNT